MIVPLAIGSTLFAAGIAWFAWELVHAPFGVETEQGFRQLDCSELPDDPADLSGAGGADPFIVHREERFR